LAVFSGYILALAKNLYKKCARKTLMKLTLGVNFINIFKHFLLIFWRQKITKPNITSREKLLNLLSYKKGARKMLMKLTPGLANRDYHT
jgi:hypothetical protein